MQYARGGRRSTWGGGCCQTGLGLALSSGLHPAGVLLASAIFLLECLLRSALHSCQATAMWNGRKRRQDAASCRFAALWLSGQAQKGVEAEASRGVEDWWVMIQEEFTFELSGQLKELGNRGVPVLLQVGCLSFHALDLIPLTSACTACTKTRHRFGKAGSKSSRG